MKVFIAIILFGLSFTVLVIWSPWGYNAVHFKIYHTYYLIAAVLIWAFSYRYFGGRFVRPKWKLAGKFIAYLMISFVLLLKVGHYALIFIIGHQALGGVGHYYICKKYNIDFWTCQPEEKYLEVTQKWASGNFKEEFDKNKT